MEIVVGETIFDDGMEEFDQRSLQPYFNKAKISAAFGTHGLARAVVL